uniref:hypothetical protein n=1 Tax=Modestobacter roseus TaxID=1181884 RepID=UPI0034DFB597
GLVVAATTLSGCTVGRPLNSQDRAAILGASMGAALQNAHDAAWGNDDRQQQDEYRYNEARRHHHRHHDELSTDTVRKNGKLGYYDAYGKFHAY